MNLSYTNSKNEIRWLELSNEDFEQLRKGKIILDVEQEKLRTRTEQDDMRLGIKLPATVKDYNKIMQWFHWYDNQTQQVLRDKRMGLQWEAVDNEGNIFTCIEELDTAAYHKQIKIRELRQQLKGGL